jgi:adenosine deaminase
VPSSIPMTLSAAELAALPKVELHLHLEGTLEPEVIFDLAERNRVRLPYADIDSLRSRYHFADLQGFLDLYYDNMAVLRTEADFADLAFRYVDRSVAGGLRHTEVFVDPQAHLARGVPVEVVLEGTLAGLRMGERAHGVTSGLLVAFLRERPPAEAEAVLTSVVSTGLPVVGVGLDSAEVGNPPGPFADVFAKARAEGLHCVAHAGEEGPASYVTEALDVLAVERIDHGIRSLEDERLVDRLVAAQTPLTVCPLSNVRLGVVPDLRSHPLPEMLERGLRVTVNSDDPAYFGGYIDDNYRAVHEHLGVGAVVLADVARHAVNAAFITPAQRSALLSEIDRWQGRLWDESPPA